MLGATAFTACDDDFARPPMMLPETVDVEANYSITQVKNRFWATMGTPTDIGVDAETGDSMIFKGRVCSSDESGNIFKKIYVQSHDENGNQIAMAFYVNAKDMYAQLPFGQEVVVWGTGLTIGSASGVLAFGDPADKDFYMTEERFYAHIARTGIGVPDPSKVDTTATTLAHINEIKGNTDSLKVWQCRLVRINDVSWVEAGQPYSNEQYGTNRYLTDENGNRLMVRNSTFTNYSTEPLPYGKGSVVGILSQFNGNLQLTMIDQEGCIDFDGEAPEPGPEVDPAGDGTEASPYNVTKALEVATALKDGEETAEVFVNGVISAIGEISTSFGNGTYTITDEGGSKTIGVFRGYWLGGEKFTSENQLALGAKVVVKGKLVNYKGNTPQLAQGNQLVSYNGETAGGDTPTPPTPSDELKYTLTTSVASGSSYVLVVDGQYGASIAATYSYGRFNLTDCTISNDSFTGPSNAAFVMTMVEGKGYTITDHSGRFLGMDTSHLTTFQIFDTANDGCYWTTEFIDGKVKISNTLNTDCFVCVSKGTEGTYYTNMAPAKAPAEYKLPQLFKAE